METLHSWLFTLVDVLLVGLGPCGFLRKPRGQGSLVWAPAWPGQVPRVPLTVGRGPGCPPSREGGVRPAPPCALLPRLLGWSGVPVSCLSVRTSDPSSRGRREGNESVSRRRWNSAPAFISSLPGRRPWNPKCCDTPERGDIAAWDQHPHAGRSATSDSLIPKSWICVPLREDVLT